MLMLEFIKVISELYRGWLQTHSGEDQRQQKGPAPAVGSLAAVGALAVGVYPYELIALHSYGYKV